MKRVFISYRRADSLPTAARIADELRSNSGVKDLFVDIDDIQYGDNFATQIQQKMDAAGVVLILLGRDWRGAYPDGSGARILEDGDWVRQEAAAALASGKRIIPVLIDGALMPAKADLPADLSRLPEINAFQLRNSHFRQDMEFLQGVMAGGKAGGKRWTQKRFTLGGLFGRLVLGLLITLMLLAAIMIAGVMLTPPQCNITCVARDLLDLPTAQDAQRYVVVLGAGLLLAGTLGPPILYGFRALKPRRR